MLWHLHYPLLILPRGTSPLDHTLEDSQLRNIQQRPIMATVQQDSNSLEATEQSPGGMEAHIHVIWPTTDDSKMDRNHCRSSSLYRYDLHPLRKGYGSEHHCLRAILTIRQSSVVLNRSLSPPSQNQSSTTPNSNRSPLLRLPRELRDLIYEYSLLTIHISYHHFSPG